MLRPAAGHGPRGAGAHPPALRSPQTPNARAEPTPGVLSRGEPGDPQSQRHRPRHRLGLAPRGEAADPVRSPFPACPRKWRRCLPRRLPASCARWGSAGGRSGIGGSTASAPPRPRSSPCSPASSTPASTRTSESPPKRGRSSCGSPPPGPPKRSARRRWSRSPPMIRGRLGRLVVGEGDEGLPDAVVRLLRGRGRTMATAEWGTTGLVAEWLGSVPGAAGSYLGGSRRCRRVGTRTAHFGTPGGVLRHTDDLPLDPRPASIWLRKRLPSAGGDSPPTMVWPSGRFPPSIPPRPSPSRSTSPWPRPRGSSPSPCHLPHTRRC